MKKQIFIIPLVLLFCAGTIYLYQKSTNENTTPSVPAFMMNGVINAANFTCKGNKSIQAVFLKDHVNITLSDKRIYSLPQAMSASGARYANADESIVFWNKGTTAFIMEKSVTTFDGCAISAPTQPSNQLANPASTNCLKVGGNLVIDKRGDGGEYGLCYFEDNRACEEWALFRGDCPVGGRKTTGFDTIDQKYCAWLGGNTTAVKNSVCTFKDGTSCPTLDYYNGTCPKLTN